MKLLQFLAILIFTSTVTCRPNNLDDDDYDVNIAEPEHGIQNDNYDYEGDNDEEFQPEIPEPQMITQPKHFVAKENETVRLPCDIDNGDTLVAMWRKNNELIYQDAIRFNSFGNNFQIENRTLIIYNVGSNETANYTCSIPLSNTNTLNVTHQLFVKTAPKIVSLKARNNVVTLNSGDTLVLTCQAMGYPTPTIKWSRKGKRIAAEGETMEIENVSHHDAGEYQCLADNNIEPPAHHHIRISIVHKPIVTLEKLTVNSDENLDSQLICYVHAVPQPTVVWKKDGLNVVKNEHRHLKHHNHTYILEIQKVQLEDFGVYTCSAYNREGRSEKNVTLTGYPSPAQFLKIFHDGDQNVGFVWNLESNSPVIKYSLEYKKIAESEWKVVAPEVLNAEGNLYTINHTLTNLPKGHYEAKVRAQNTYGWSEYSDLVKFNSAGKHHHKHTQAPVTSDIQKEETIIYKGGFNYGNEIANEEGRLIKTPTLAPEVAAQIPTEEYIENTNIKPSTQERQQQAEKGTQENIIEIPTPESPAVAAQIPITEEFIENAKVKPSTQERHQAEKSAQGNQPSNATNMLSMLWLLCIPLLTALLSH